MPAPLMTVIRFAVAVLLTAGTLPLIVIASPAVARDWRIGAALGIALVAVFFALLTWVWRPQRK